MPKAWLVTGGRGEFMCEVWPLPPRTLRCKNKSPLRHGVALGPKDS